MLHAFYNLLWTLAVPPGKAYLHASAKHRELIHRFDPPPRAGTTPPIWIHACSVGEVGVARTLARALTATPGAPPLLFTASTRTGMSQAQQQLAALGSVAWCPFDSLGAVRRFLRAAQPALLLLTETEIWPNLLRECERAGVPVMLYNGRISEKHVARYQKFAGLFVPAFARLAVAAMQDEIYADRVRALGAKADHVCITGNLKFDAVSTVVDATTRARLRAQHGILADAPIVVFGSTRPGDEAMAASCWASLRTEYPTAHLVIALRHLERIDEALAPFGEPVLRRSALGKGTLPAGQRVHCVDTHGELVQFYSLATVAVIGGSFSAEVQGHNPLEPAALGVPVVFGPHMANFAEAARVLCDARGAVQVSSTGELLATLQRLLGDPAECRHLGTRGRKAVLDRQGATERTVRIVQELLAFRAEPSPKENPTP